MTWIPVILIWAALITIGAYYIREWWRVGRDPKGTTIIPRFAAPEGLSPMALFFIYRRATAEDVAINAGALGSLAELIRRKLVRIEEAPAGPQIVAQEGGDGEGLQDDLVKFLDRLIPRGRAATTEDFRKAAYQHWIDIHAMLAKRIISFNLGITLSGAAILIAAALVTVVLVNWTLPAGQRRGADHGRARRIAPRLRGAGDAAVAGPDAADDCAWARALGLLHHPRRDRADRRRRSTGPPVSSGRW